MKCFRRVIIKILAPSSPLNFIGILIYKFVYHIICLYWRWRFPTTLIWARNSYQSNDLIPGLSDIDFTIVSSDDNLSVFAKDVLLFFKRLFLIVGETNFYSLKTLKLIKEIYNYYELQRDPLLMKYAHLQKKANEIDATIYLMRTFESDKHNLEKRKKLRQRKWQRVFKLVNIDNSEITKSNLINLLDNRLGRKIMGNSMLYSPHTWLEFNWTKLDDDIVKSTFSTLNDHECEIIIGQVRWEIFGILTQLPFLSNRNDMKYHFDNLKKIVSFLPQTNKGKLSSIFDEARRLV